MIKADCFRTSHLVSDSNRTYCTIRNLLPSYELDFVLNDRHFWSQSIAVVGVRRRIAKTANNLRLFDTCCWNARHFGSADRPFTTWQRQQTFLCRMQTPSNAGCLAISLSSIHSTIMRLYTSLPSICKKSNALNDCD